MDTRSMEHQHGNRRLSIPFEVRLHSDEGQHEKDAVVADSMELGSGYDPHSSGNELRATSKRDEGQSSEAMKSMRRISHISVGSEFDGMADDSDASARDQQPTVLSGYHYVLPLGGLEDDSDDEPIQPDNNDSMQNRSGRKKKFQIAVGQRICLNDKVTTASPTQLTQSKSMPTTSLQMALARSRSSNSMEDDDVHLHKIDLDVGRRSRSSSAGSEESMSKMQAKYDSSLQARLMQLKASQAAAEEVLRHASPVANKSRTNGQSVSPMRSPNTRQPLERANSFVIPNSQSRMHTEREIEIGQAIANGTAEASDASLDFRMTSPLHFSDNSEDDLNTTMHSMEDSGAEPVGDSLADLAAAAGKARARMRKKHSERKRRLHRVLVKMNSTSLLKPVADRDPSMSPGEMKPDHGAEDTLLQCTIEDNVNTSFRMSKSGDIITPSGEEKATGQTLPGCTSQTATPASPIRFPQTARKISSMANLQNDDDSFGLSTIDDDSRISISDTIASKNDRSTTLNAIFKESTNEEGSSAALTTATASTMLKSVASDVLLDPEKFLRPSSTPDESSSGQNPGDDMSAISLGTTLTNGRNSQRGTIDTIAVERKPEEDASTAATPFFGAALRQLNAMAAGTTNHSRISGVGSDSTDDDDDDDSASSFATPDDSSIKSEYLAAKSRARRRRSTLLAIKESANSCANISVENSQTRSDELNIYDESMINPVEQKLMSQIDEKFVGRRDSIMSVSTSSSGTRSTKRTARRMSLGVAAPLRRVDNSFYSAGTAETGNLEHVELDTALPPPRKHRNESAAHQSIADEYSHIESAASEMANTNNQQRRARRKRNSFKSVSSQGMRRGSRGTIDLSAFNEFKLNRSTNSDDDGASSNYGTHPPEIVDRPVKRVNSMYRARQALSSEEQNEHHDQNWRALLQGNAIMFKNTGERPVLKRMYTYAGTLMCVAICLIIPLVIVKRWASKEENPFPSGSICNLGDLSDSLKYCTCNSTEGNTFDESVASRYADLIEILVDQGVFEPGNGPDDMESCENDNVAVLWIAEGAWDLYGNDVSRTVQRYVLAYFFLQLGGVFWTRSTQWMTESDVCDWFGVFCSRMGLATSLHLNGYNLSGVIPSELSFISFLTSLRLNENENITGTLPASLSLLSHLTEVDLSRGSLSGNFSTDAFVASSDSLGILNLSFNMLEGKLPTTLVLLTKLETLDLSSNSMDGALPSSLGGLRELRNLLLAGNGFIGTLPPSLANLTKIELLDLSGNQFSGEIEEDICRNLPLLQEFSLSCFGLEINSCQCCTCEDAGI